MFSYIAGIGLVLKYFFRVCILLLLIGIVVEILLLVPEDLQKRFEAEALAQSRAASQQDADQIMHGVHLIETSDGQREWELWADRALGFSGKGSWNVERVRVVFFTDEGLKYNVTGDRGVIKTDSKDMLIEGNVVTTTSNDYNFYTNSMIYHSEARELKTAHPVRIKGPRDSKGYRMNLTGQGMLAELKNSDMYIHRNVKGTRPLEEDRTLYIRSREAKLSSKSSEAFFYEDVEMIVDTQTITGPKARLKYDENQSDLKVIEFEGGTRVSDENKWATSEKLNIFVPEKRLVLKGKPRVVQNNDEIKGEVIVFLNGGKQVKVLSGKANLTEKLREKQL